MAYALVPPEFLDLDAETNLALKKVAYLRLKESWKHGLENERCIFIWLQQENDPNSDTSKKLLEALELVRKTYTRAEFLFTEYKKKNVAQVGVWEQEEYDCWFHEDLAQRRFRELAAVNN